MTSTRGLTTGTRLRALAFCGGGSGGHLFPGVAVAEQARRRFPDCRIVFFCPAGAIERRIFEHSPFEVSPVNIRAPGRSGAGWLRYSLAALRALRETSRVLTDDFDVVFGLGGYASVPGVLAARARRRPVILLEQNRVAGRVNRLLAPLATVVSSSYAEMRLKRSRRVVVTGNPVRRELRELAERRSGRVRNGSRLAVLVVGGSQGAAGINRAVTTALRGLEGWRGKIRFIHIAGARDREGVARAYREGGWPATVLEFAPHLPELMSECDLAVTRAGGTTMSELAVLGVPAVLVPYPYHRDRHQLLNAESYADAGAGVVLEEREVSARSLGEVIRSILFVPGRLEGMARRARGLARPEAASTVVALAVELKEQCQSAFDSSC